MQILWILRYISYSINSLHWIWCLNLVYELQSRFKPFQTEVNDFPPNFSRCWRICISEYHFILDLSFFSPADILYWTRRSASSSITSMNWVKANSPPGGLCLSSGQRWSPATSFPSCSQFSPLSGISTNSEVGRTIELAKNRLNNRERHMAGRLIQM